MTHPWIEKSGFTYDAAPGLTDGKFIVFRRDGSQPEWPHFVLGGRDPAAAIALRSYADEVERLGMDPMFIDYCRCLADDFDQYRAVHGDGDPDAPKHRTDNLEMIKRLGRIKFRDERGA